MSEDSRISLLKSAFKTFPDFPKPGIMFQDIFSVYGNVEAHAALDSLAREYAK